MENFKKKLQFQLRILLAKLVFACSALVASYRFAEIKEISLPASAQDFVSGFQYGIIMGFLGILFFYIIRNLIAIRNPDRLKKLYISETDERKQFIRLNSGAEGIVFIIYGLAVGTAVSGNINAMVFFTLLGACFFAISVRVVLRLYYKNKF